MSDTPEGLITIDDFAKVKLKTARVLSCEKHPDADKLLVLQIEVGKEERQLVAGLAEHYAPDELVGRTIVIVANLKPAKLRGKESQGMLLAANTPEGGAVVLAIDSDDMPSGAKVS
jgi:methionyl-tRNA synthetase